MYGNISRCNNHRRRNSANSNVNTGRNRAYLYSYKYHIASAPIVQGTASYLWSTGETTASIDVTTPGTYSVVVTDDDNGCTVTSADVTITEDVTAPTVTVTPDATELTCIVTSINIACTNGSGNS